MCLRILPLLLLLCGTLSCATKETKTITIDSVSVSTQEDTSQTLTTDSADRPRDTGNLPTEPGQVLKPYDNASHDPSFVKFRSELLATILARDVAKLIAAMDTNIRLSYGTDGGLGDLHRMWKPVDQESKLWKELDWILRHGGEFREYGGKQHFWAPYVYSNWPDGKNAPEPYNHAAVLSADLPVYAGKDSTSAPIARLSYNIVEVLDGGHIRESKPDWVKIKTPSGKTGFVRSDQVRSQLDYRAGFIKDGGKWKMTAFIAGD